MKHDTDAEELLESFSPKPPITGLKERVLRGAAEKAFARRVLTPAWRWALAGSSVLVLLISLADGWTSTAGLNRLNALLEVPEPGSISLEKAVEKEMAAYREALPDLDKSLLERLQMTLLEEKRVAEIHREPSRLEEAFYEN
ncbi:MAG: hypothetical protein WAU81_13930 [Candidatus Aminicenantales bacterium]